MTIDDADQFAELMEAVGEMTDTKLSPMRIKLYFQALARFEFDVITAAFSSYFGTGNKYAKFPQPNQIVELIEGSEEDADAHAWNTLNDAIRKVGVYQSVIIEDGALSAAIETVFGSWVAACETHAMLHDVAWSQKRKDFSAAYRAQRRLIHGGGRQSQPVLLLGHCDMQNNLTRGNWAPEQRLERSAFGVIHVDGAIESKYLDIDQATGLPTATLADAIALPAVEQQLLTAGEAPRAPDLELTPEDARSVQARLREFIATLSTSKTMPKARRGRPLTPDEEAARRDELRKQAEDVSKASATVSDASTEENGSTDRRADQSSGPAGTSDGVSLRVADRAEMEVRSGVAGSSDRVRARGSDVRSRDPRAERVRKPARKNGTDR